MNEESPKKVSFRSAIHSTKEIMFSPVDACWLSAGLHKNYLKDFH